MTDLTAEGEAFVKTAELAANDRGPNPFPGRKVQDLTIAEQEKLERWLGIQPSSEERRRRERIRHQQRQESGR